MDEVVPGLAPEVHAPGVAGQGQAGFGGADPRWAAMMQATAGAPSASMRAPAAASGPQAQPGLPQPLTPSPQAYLSAQALLGADVTFAPPASPAVGVEPDPVPANGYEPAPPTGVVPSPAAGLFQPDQSAAASAAYAPAPEAAVPPLAAPPMPRPGQQPVPELAPDLHGPTVGLAPDRAGSLPAV
ncbi:MAG TPA: hypothetical protein VF143_02435, partial [Candidatus Nanopelagicales bacterium]